MTAFSLMILERFPDFLKNSLSVKLFSQQSQIDLLVNISFKPHKNFHFRDKFLVLEIILNLFLVFLNLLHWWLGGKRNVLDYLPLGVVLMVPGGLDLGWTHELLLELLEIIELQ